MNDAPAYFEALTAQEAAACRVPPGYQYRLPTEAEWEYSCRAGTTTEWNTGTSLVPAQANLANSNGETTAVGGYAPNSWGLHDMHGNVFEWCLDSTDSSANYPSGPVSDPFVTTGSQRRYRGGSWFNDSRWCHSANRVWHYPTYQADILGFRIVLAPSLVP